MTTLAAGRALTGDPANAAAWQIERVLTLDALHAASAWRHSPEHWLLEHDPHWNAPLLGEPDTAVLLASKDGRPFAGIFVHPMGLQLALGELSVAAIPVRRHVLTGGLGRGTASASELALLLHRLRGDLGAGGVIFLQGVHQNEPLRDCLDLPQVRQEYKMLTHGAPYRRCRIRLEGDFEAYLASLGSSTRKKLKKTLRLFKERVGDRFELQVVKTPAELERALPDLQRLSAKTYQAKLLGLGFTPGNTAERRMRFGMARGIGRVALLRVQGQPIAFKAGYICNGSFHSMESGYDPAWAEVQPGILQHLFMIQELRRNNPEVRYFDFMYGESVYKTTLSNTFHEESQFYLIPRTVRGWSTWAALTAVNQTSSAIGRGLETLKLKEKVRKLLRRAA